MARPTQKRLLTQQEAADRLGITARWVRELLKVGLPVEGKGRARRYPWPAIRDWYNEHLKQRIEAQLTPSDLRQERAALLRVQRRIAEYDLAYKQGHFITVADCHAHTTAIYVTVDRLLTHAPGRYTPELAECPGKVQIHGALKVMMDDMRAELLRELDRLDTRQQKGKAA